MVEQGAGQKVLQKQVGRMSEEFPEEGAVEGGREAKGDRDGGLGEWARGFGRYRRRVSGVTGLRNIRGWWERERVQARESEQHPGEPVKNLPGQS